MKLLSRILGSVRVLEVTLTAGGYTVRTWSCKPGGIPQQVDQVIFMHECFMSSVLDLLKLRFVSHLCIKQFIFEHIFLSLNLFCILQRSNLFLMLAL